MPNAEAFGRLPFQDTVWNEMQTVLRFLFVLFVVSSFVTRATAQFGGGWIPNSPGAYRDTASIPLGVTTKKGKPILSRPCDPMMSAEREAELVSILMRDNPFDWREETPLNEIRDAIATLAPIRVHQRAFEELGLDPDNLQLVDRTRDLAGPVVQHGGSGKWWTSGRAVAGGQPHRWLGAVLQNMLEPHGLTLEIRGGQFIISTSDYIEEYLALRIYDVRPLVQPMNASDANYKEFDSLMNVIQTNINPDTWEMLGGPSTMSVYSVHGHDWMMVNAPTMVHLRLQRLLDDLNQ